MDHAPPVQAGLGLGENRKAWHLSLPFIISIYVFIATLYQGLWKQLVLRDGDTLWHIATGRWILEHRSVPDADPFSHSMPGVAWTAHEWLSEILLAMAHDLAGFSGVVALTGVAFAIAIALLSRALISHLSPTRTLLLAMVAVLMTSAHLLARPHILAMPLLVAWTAGLVSAADRGRSPSRGLLPLMVVWANMHGGFTLGVALAVVFAAEALAAAWRQGQIRQWASGWGVFIALTLLAALVTPHGLDGIVYTWQLMMEEDYVLSHIGEWASPNFHEFQPLMLWLLGGMALILHQGLRLPPLRLLLLLGLIYLSLKHVRNIELLGLLVPLFVAAPFASQWRWTAKPDEKPDAFQRWLARLPSETSLLATALALATAMVVAVVAERTRPAAPSPEVAPAKALEAARAARVSGNVLNTYQWGGYLIYSGIPVFIDGRGDMYREALMRPYIEALGLSAPGKFEALLDKYRIGWTLLAADTPAVAMLDKLPNWRRVYADGTAAVHVRIEH